MGRRNFVFVAIAAVLPALLSACSSHGGPACQAGAIECRGADSEARCASDGSGWLVGPCDAGQACTGSGCAPIVCPGTPCPDPLVCKDGGCVARACTAGEHRCTSYSFMIEDCAATGAGFDAPRPCPNGQACQDAECQPVVCKPGDVGCSDDGAAIRTCIGSGTGWTSAACFGANVCEDGGCKAIACPPKTLRCRPDNLAVQRCKDLGTAWADSQVCPEDQACEDAACKPRICDPLQWTCADDFLSRWQCNASGTATLAPEDCDEATACRDGECRPVLCTPGAATCTPDAIGLLTCDPTGTRNDLRTDCDVDKACAGGVCVAALSPLGEVVKVRMDQGAVTLSPGLYAVAVADAELAGDAIAFPLTLSGYVKDPPYAMQAIAKLTVAPRLSPRWACGTPARMRDLPRPLAVPHLASLPPPRFDVVGDTRTFHVIAADGYTLVERKGLLRLAGNLANFWEDVTSGPAEGTLTLSALQEIGDRLDKGVFARDVALYGPPTDVDGNGKIDVLFTDMLPTDTAAAYVWPVTLYPEGALGFAADHGEVVYSMRPGGDYTEADMAGIIAHEFSHLLVSGRRITPWLSHIADLPDWVMGGGVYLGEGLAELAHAWSGQALLDSAYYALQETSLWSIGALFQNDYYQDSTLNGAHYGVAAVALGYLFLQAGGVDVTGPATLVDRGGVPYLAVASDRQEGFARIAPLDGRSEIDWYADMAAALLLTTLPSAPGPLAAADPRYQFPTARYDSWFGGPTACRSSTRTPPCCTGSTGPASAARCPVAGSGSSPCWCSATRRRP